MRDLSFRSPPSLAIAEGATTPVPPAAGAVAYSTTLNRLVWWTGSAWQGAGFSANSPAIWTDWVRSAVLVYEVLNFDSTSLFPPAWAQIDYV